MKTGNTDRKLAGQAPLRRASMEPGHEDREYLPPHLRILPRPPSLNGARP